MDINALIHSKSIYYKLKLKLALKIGKSELPNSKNIGNNISFPHGLNGIVIHPNTIIEDNVTIFHQVTCGRGDMYKIDPRIKNSSFRGIVLSKGCILCAGAKIICNRGILVVVENTIIGANAVLTKSTGNDEIWGEYRQS